MRGRSLACMSLALALFMMPAPPVAPEGSGSYPPPASGDWNVTNDTSVANETIYLDGNLTVSGANLTLENVTVDFNSTGRSYYATVAGDAGLKATNCTFLVGSSSSLWFDLAGAANFFGCDFLKGNGTLGIDFQGHNSSLLNSIIEGLVQIDSSPAPDFTGSLLRGTGHLDLPRDLTISNLTFMDCPWGAQGEINTTFDNCTFQDCQPGLYLGDNSRTSNCKFIGCDGGITGVNPWTYTNETVSNCSFDNCTIGILTGHTTIINCSFNDCSKGVKFHDPSSIFNCTFAGCNNSLDAIENAEIIASTFTGEDGTGIQWNADHLNVTGCAFEFPNGTGITGTGMALNISESTFNGGLQAINVTADSGGAIRNCSFNMPEGQDAGAAPFLELGGDFVVRDAALSGGNGTLLSVRSGDSRAINVTIPSDRAEVRAGATLEVEWYLDSTVVYQNGTPAANATVREEDRFGNAIGVSATGPDGRAPRIEAPEYLREFDRATRYTPYWLNASKGGLASAISVNLNQNLELTLVLGDVTPPRVQIIFPANGTLTNRSRIEIAGTAGDDIGVASVQVRADGGAWVSADGTANWTAMLDLTDGDHLIEAQAIDDAGNTAPGSMRLSVDTLPPFLDITYPTRELLVNTTSMEITGRTEPGCTVRIDGEQVPFYLGQFSAEVELQEGTNEIIATARDPAGNLNSSVVRVTRDTIPPGLTVSVPRDGAVTGERVLAVSGTVEEGARVLVDGREAAVSGPFFSANVTLVEGENIIIIQAQDPAGNLASIALRVTMDTSPQFISVDLENGTITRNAYLLLSGETKNGSALSVNGVAAVVGPDGRFRMNISLQLGLNTIHLVARGPLGNTASLERTVTREETPAPPKSAERQPAQNGNTPAVLIAVAIVIAVVLALALFFRRPPEPIPGTATPDGPAQKGSGE